MNIVLIIIIAVVLVYLFCPDLRSWFKEIRMRRYRESARAEARITLRKPRVNLLRRIREFFFWHPNLEAWVLFLILLGFVAVAVLVAITFYNYGWRLLAVFSLALIMIGGFVFIDRLYESIYRC